MSTSARTASLQNLTDSIALAAGQDARPASPPSDSSIRAESTGTEISSQRPRTCLIVDDSQVIRTVAHRILRELNFKTVEAVNGRDALAAWARELPDVILLDWNMPIMDGFAFLRELRAQPGNQGTKVIFCTTENSVERITEAIHAGADEYIMKPFDREILETKFRLAGLL